MRHVTSAMVAAFTLVLTAPVAVAGGGVVEAVGEAQIKNGDEVSAKEAATMDGLKKCMEKVVGIYIESNFSALQKEVVNDDKSKFYSDVSDQLVKKSKGFIKTYDVVDEAVQGDVMKVKVRAEVYESKIQAEAEALAELRLKAGNPKLMVIIQDVYVDEDGNVEVAKEDLVGSFIEKEMLARGFELRGKLKARKVADKSPEAYDAWVENAGGAARLARNAGADILITGRVEIQHSVYGDDVPIEALRGQTKVNITGSIRAMNAADGEIISVKPLQAKEAGTDLGRAMHRALQGSRGKKINIIESTTEQVLIDARRAFKKAADRGQAYVIKLSGIKSFRKQGRGFLKVLEGIDGVSKVKQKSFKGGTLVVDVLCKCSSDDLQSGVFGAADSSASFSTLDIDGVSGKELTFKL